MTTLATNDFRSPAGFLALQSLPRVGPATALRATLQVTRLEQLLERHGAQLDEAFERAQASLADYATADVGLLSFFDEPYPDRLRELSDPPPLIYVRGDVGLLAREDLKRYGGGSETRKIEVADLSQAFMYAYAYRDPGSATPPRAALVYPSERPGQPELVRLEVGSVAERMADAQLIGIGVHIPTLLDELRTAGDRAGGAINQALISGTGF